MIALRPARRADFGLRRLKKANEIKTFTIQRSYNMTLLR